MLPPDKSYRAEGQYQHVMNTLSELKQYYQDCSLSPYYSELDFKAYVDKTYPIIEEAFVSVLESAGVAVDTDVTIGDLVYPYAVRSQKIAFVFAHNLTHSSSVDMHQLCLGTPGENTYFFSHQCATVNANRHGYECMHIFDWDDICKLTLLFSPKQLVSCANCEVDVVTESELVLFLDLYHLRGNSDVAFDRGFAHLGLYYDDDLVYVLTVGHPKYRKNYSAEIYRVCSNPEYHVAGGWNLLFNSYCNAYHPSSVVALREMSKEFAAPYAEMHMTLIGYTEPRTFWGRGSDRLTEGPRFLKKLNVQYDSKYHRSTQNLALMLNHGWVPISDCGSAVYEWRNVNE